MTTNQRTESGENAPTQFVDALGADHNSITLQPIEIAKKASVRTPTKVDGESTDLPK